MLNAVYFVFPSVSFMFPFPLICFDLVDSRSKMIYEEKKKDCLKTNSIFLLCSVLCDLLQI